MKPLILTSIALGLTAVVCLLSCRPMPPETKAQRPPAGIIPAPEEMRWRPGFFRLTPATRIVVSPEDDELASIGRLLEDSDSNGTAIPSAQEGL